MRTWRSCMRAALQNAFIVIPKIPQTHHVCRDSARACRKQMRAASQDSESSCNSSQKDRRATTCKKRHRCLSISVRQRCFTQPACGCAVFGRGTFVQMSEQSCGVSAGAAKQGTFATRESFSIFKASAFMPSIICQGISAQQ